MKVLFYTLGCKVNQYESEVLRERFSQNGYEPAGAGDTADVCIVNSCTVTATGDRKTRQVLRRLRRENPGAIIVLTGCFPQAFPAEAADIEADIITGTTDRAGLIDLVGEYFMTRTKIVKITPHAPGAAFESMAAAGFSGHTRAFIKIEDGCDRYCSYCIIPYARGPVRSKPLSEIKSEIASLAGQGYREVVLVGINLPCYGKDLGLNLTDAVTAAAEAGALRIRLGSLEPELLTKKHLQKLADTAAFCPQFHLSMQSGCDKTLLAMNRHYTTAEYEEIVQNIRDVFTNPAITTDVVVGFPGESDEDFAETVAFVEKIGFAKVHVFPYSARPGTKAANLPDQLPKQTKEARAKTLIAVAERLSEKFLRSQIGTVQSVLFETTKTAHGLQGYSENYTPVAVAAGAVPGEIAKVKITAVAQGYCLGEIIG